MARHDSTATASGTFASRLRDKRTELGKSQAEIAGEDLSPSYISLLESGKRIPTSDVVGVLAKRLDCTPGYLLRGEDPRALEEFQLRLRYAELALHNGEAYDAVAQLEPLLKDTGPDDTVPTPAELIRQARRLWASALEMLGRLEDAIVEFEALAEEAEATRRWGDVMRLTIDLVRCYQEAGDVSHSLDLGRSALERIEQVGLGGSDVHAELVSAVIGAYYVRGDLVKARQLARRAVADVEGRGSPRGRAAVYWNASLVAESANDVSGALVLAEKAIALYSEGNDERAIARLRVAYGWLLLRSTPAQPKAAMDELLQAHALLEDVGSVVDLAYCETELARCWLLLGRPKSAMKYADVAAERLGDAPRLESAYVQLARSGALLALNRRQEAVAGYKAAANLLRSLELSRLAAAVWRELADGFSSLGLHADAGVAYQQALTEAGVPAAPDLLVARTPSSPGASGRTTQAVR